MSDKWPGATVVHSQNVPTTMACINGTLCPVVAHHANGINMLTIREADAKRFAAAVLGMDYDRVLLSEVHKKG